MNIELDKKSPTDASIKITLKEADYQPEVEKKIKKYSKQITLKGFRPGKVPPALVKRMYGSSILLEEIQNILGKSLNEYIQENDLPVVGEPIPDAENSLEIDWKTQKDFEFIYKIGLIPEFEYNLDQISVTSYKIQHKDEDLEEVIEDLRSRFGETEYPDEVDEEDFVYGELKEVLEIQEEKEGEDSEIPEKEPYQQKVLLPLNQFLKKEVTKFVGRKKGDIIDFNIHSLFKKKLKGISLATGLTEDEARDLPENFTFEIDSITRTTPAEMDEEFFKKALGNEEITTEDTFLEEVKSVMAENYQKESDFYFNKQLKEGLQKYVEITLPDDFLKEWLYIANQDKFSKEEIEKEYDGFAKNLRWDILKGKLAKEAEIQIEKEEIQEKAKGILAMQFGGNIPDSPEILKHFDSLVENYLSINNGKNYQDIAKMVLENQVFVYLKDKVQVTEAEIGIDEFQKLSNN